MLRGTNDSVVQAYFDYMVDMAVLFGADEETARDELEDVLGLEIDLANVSCKPVHHTEAFPRLETNF